MDLSGTWTDWRFDPEVYADRQDGLEGFPGFTGVLLKIQAASRRLHVVVSDAVSVSDAS